MSYSAIFFNVATSVLKQELTRYVFELCFFSGILSLDCLGRQTKFYFATKDTPLITKIFYLQFLFKFLLIGSRLRLYFQAVDSNCREHAFKIECSKILYLRCSDWKGISCQVYIQMVFILKLNILFLNTCNCFHIYYLKL